jgi:protein-S-isoprenylcysteine O-methyltransferase Ste14
VIGDFVVRTAIWAAALALWVSLHRPRGRALLPAVRGLPTTLGYVIVLLGISLYVAGAVCLARAKNDTGHAPVQLLTRGPYAHVRNPVYLAMMVIVLGLSLVYQAWQPSDIARLLLLFAGAHLAVVLLEEPATRRRFGAEYQDYCSRVPRWIPRL